MSQNTRLNLVRHALAGMGLSSTSYTLRRDSLTLNNLPDSVVREATALYWRYVNW